MWPRADAVTVTFYNTVDGSAIAFGVFDVLVDGANSTNPITVTHVMFHLVVENGGIVYSDAWYNVNVTGATFAVGIAWTFQIWVRYASTIDSFGIDFEWFWLYLDGSYCPINNPFVIDRTITITVRDFAGRLLYTHLYDFYVDSRFVNIPLAVTTLVVTNNFDTVDVIFHYSIAGIENSFPLAAGRSFDLRVALGTYTWWITTASGHDIEDQRGNDIQGSKAITGAAFVSFGWTAVVPPDPIIITSSSWLDLLIPVIGCIAAIEVIARLPFKKAKKKAEARPRR
jgi:hypothetical protein